MLDLKWIRENPDLFDNALKRRGLSPLSQKLIDLDKHHRESITELQSLQERKNDLAKEMPLAFKNPERRAALLAEGSEIKNKIALQEEKVAKEAASIHDILITTPNIIADDIPHGTTDADAKEIKKHLAPTSFSFTPKAHYELGENLGMMLFEKASEIAGSRFVVLKGGLARLERALAQFMLDIHTTEFGYEEVSPPLLVKDQTLYGTGQLPKFHEDSFRTTDGRWLIPTAEVSLTNLVSGEILDENKLPQRYVAHTACFRSEAGAAGKDTRGMLRQHQFYKVELVSITHPDHSEEEHERMTKAAETVLERLKLPYRVIMLCDGDTGFQSRKTYDIEVWCPGQNTYREISSCSNCSDFQARRMNARFRPQMAEGKQSKLHFVHTLNGSGVAVGRALIAVVENYQQEDGSIRIPDALVPYMNGQKEIRK